MSKLDFLLRMERVRIASYVKIDYYSFPIIVPVYQDLYELIGNSQVHKLIVVGGENSTIDVCE